MLTPAATDPNRAKEITRMKSEPAAFGSKDTGQTPADWSDVGLVADRKESDKKELAQADQPKKRGRPAKTTE